jgi:hypothetical protein
MLGQHFTRTHHDFVWQSGQFCDFDASEQSVYTEYPDPRRDEWQTKIMPALKKVPLAQLVKLSCLSRSTLMEIRAGRSRPHRKNRELLLAVLRRRGRL